MLYPVPNVLEPVVIVLLVARDMVAPAARDCVAVPVARCRVAALRAVAVRKVPDDALRAVVVRDVVVGVVVLVLLLVVLGSRDTIFLPAVLRTPETVCVALREIVDASRTVASATPMPTQHAKIIGKTFLILTMITMLAKKIFFGQGLI